MYYKHPSLGRQMMDAFVLTFHLSIILVSYNSSVHGLWAGLYGSKSYLYHLPAVLPWTSYFTSLCLSFIAYKNGGNNSTYSGVVLLFQYNHSTIFLWPIQTILTGWQAFNNHILPCARHCTWHICSLSPTSSWLSHRPHCDSAVRALLASAATW